ncbi:MAG TPA: aminotransferase class V-fold PLP-dependent enzyme, partial [Planctomycetota bacterium]|nr:aminotransferase class V-fold PLP-dependent enzyme [Planctomycetota bacterium]
MKRGRATQAAHPPPEAPSPSRPISPPINLASVHRFGDLDTLLAASRGQKAAWSFYRRYGHPNGRMLEETMAALEGSEDALACASGMSAVAAIYQGLCRSGDRVVASRELYGGTYAYFQKELPRIGVQVEFVSPEDLPEAIRPGIRAVAIETVSNPLIGVADLAAVARRARKAGAALIVDSTFATPVLCRPLEWGADVVFHSGTKFLNGHGDATSGVICGPRALLQPMRKFTILAGGVISPLDAWLTLRGLKTLGVRVLRASENAQAIARYLGRHRKVLRVNYPGPSKYLKPARGPM